MSRLSRWTTAALVAINVLILAFALSVAPVSAFGVDDCDESDPEGCDCLEEGTWYPAGCYKAGGTTFDCTTGGECGPGGQT